MSIPAALLPNDHIRGRGKIEIIFGPMFSGKTTELIRRMSRYEIATFRCLVIKYAGDTRYSVSDISTHDQKTLSAVSCSKLAECRAISMDYDVLGIDEGQFFTDIVEFSEELANKGKTVVVAALDGTFQRIGFGNILNLVPLAESVIKLNAVCMICFNNASFTKRISKEKAVEIIGGSDKYMATCRECHFKNDFKSPFKKNVKRSPLKAVTDNEFSPKKMLFDS